MRLPRLLALIGAAAAVSWLALYIHNSGLGYDGVEILVVTQSLARGEPFYHLVPAKPCGMYYTLFALTRLGLPLDHLTVTAVISVLLAATVASAVVYTRRFVGTTEAVVAGVLVTAAGVFMEMNFLVAEGPVVIAGFWAAYLLGRFVGNGHLRLVFLAGVLLGAAFSFKQTAAFYSVGLTLWLLAWYRPVPRAMAAAGCFAAGHALPVLAVAGYFAATGRWGPYLEWTYAVPFSMPPSTEYLDRFYTKLAWFSLALIVAVVGVVVRPDWRRATLGNPHVRLVLIAGVVALYPVTKSQAPHYVFPGAAFLSVFIAAVFTRVAGGGGVVNRLGRRVVAAGLALAVALAGSVLVYRPSAVGRLVGVADYSAEVADGDHLRQYVPPGKRVLILTDDALHLYFRSDRAPATPTVHFDFQTGYYLRAHPGAFTEALDDPQVVAVVFDPMTPPPIRFDPVPAAERQAFWVAVTRKLEFQFVRSADSISGSDIWVPKSSRR